VEVLAPEAQPENPLPEYPPEALRANAGSTWVVVRIVVSTSGGVVDIRDSPAMASGPGPFAAAFRESVVRAVQQWRFHPAVRREFEDGPDRDGDGQPDYVRMIRSPEISMYLDLRFEFSIVEGRPQVQVN
jgi:TonB family protein